MGTIGGPQHQFIILTSAHITPPALWSIVTNTNSQLATQMVKLYCPEFVLIIRF